jgi:DNA-binding transcriptional ArsR family regulator
VIVAGFVLNEMTHLDAKSTLAWFAALRRRLRPGGLILLLEPALRTTAERLQRLSEQVCADGGLTRVTEQFQQTAAELRAMNAEIQRELEATRAELRKGVLDMPRETVRRKVKQLIERGLLYADDRRRIRSTPNFDNPAVAPAIDDMHDAVRRYREGLAKYGIDC